MKPKETLSITVFSAAAFASIVTLIMHSSMLAPTEALETVALAEVFLSTFNIIILSALTTNYLEIYRDMKTSMTRSLLLFSAALLMYALSSNPLLHTLLGLKIITIGPLTFIPEIFVAAASLTLLYENYR